MIQNAEWRNGTQAVPYDDFTDCAVRACKLGSLYAAFLDFSSLALYNAVGKLAHRNEAEAAYGDQKVSVGQGSADP